MSGAEAILAVFIRLEARLDRLEAEQAALRADLTAQLDRMEKKLDAAARDVKWTIR